MDIIRTVYYIHALEVMKIFLLFYMCQFAMGLTHYFKTTFFYIYDNFLQIKNHVAKWTVRDHFGT